MELRRPGQLPGRDHRRGAAARSTPQTGTPLVDLILDEAEQKGTGRWTVKSALDLGVAGHRHRRSGVRPRAVGFGGPAQGHHRASRPAASVEKPTDAEQFTEDIRRGALRLEDHRLRPGLQPDQAGSAEYNWTSPRRHGHHLGGGVHHPGQVPQPHQGRVRQRREPADPDRRPVLPRCHRGRPSTAGAGSW